MLPPPSLSPARASAVGVGLVAVLAAIMHPFRTSITVEAAGLALVVPGVLAAWLGGRLAALVTSTSSVVAYDLVFLTKLSTRLNVIDNVVALCVFAGVASLMAGMVTVANARRAAVDRRAEEVEQLHQEAQALKAEQVRLADEVEEAEHTGEYRSALLRSVSHDLRTPLSAIRAVATDLRDDPDYDSETRSELLDLMADEAERLDRLVANLLSLSRIEAGALSPDRQAVDLDELITYRVDDLKRLLSDVRLQMDIPFVLPLAHLDYTLADQVLTNLLENAARHSPPNGVVRVKVRPAGSWLEVTVADQGEGVDPTLGDAIFEPFRRGAGSHSSGVGLAICRAIVEAHGGVISTEPAEGGGTKFRFTVPIHPSDAPRTTRS
jgi:K+-sensing histidine kinase KdpD